MITIDFERIARASETHEQIATFMLDADCTPEEVVDALEAYDTHGDTEHPEVREAMRVDEWPIIAKMDWDGLNEEAHTEHQQHIKQAAD